MDYRRFENTIVVRLNRGEEILTELKKICEAENVKLARLYALGATDHFVVGAYSVEEQKYYKNEFNGTFEITNLTGNITTMNGEYYAHLHITCADEESKCFVGVHYHEAVGVTCGSSGGLCKRAFRAEEAFLIGIKYCDELHLRQV